MPAMYCDPPTKVVHYHYGHLTDDRTAVATATLANGQRIIFSIEKASGNGGFILHLSVKHPVQVCYGPDGSKPLDMVLLGDLTAGTTAYGFIPPAAMPEPTP